MKTNSSPWYRFSTSLLLQMKEYRARLLPLTFVALLPIGFWAGAFFSLPPDSEPIPAYWIDQLTPVVGRFALTEIAERDTWPFDTGFIGMGWGLGAAALFSVIGSGARDRRLVLSGYKPWEILIARFTILFLIALPISLIPLGLVSFFSGASPTYPALVWLGSLMAGVIGVGVGLIVGSLLPRQLEGTILIIGLVGIELSVPLGVTFRHYLPFFGPQALFTAGRFAVDPIVAGHIVRSLAWALGLSLAAIALWTWRVRVHSWERIAGR
ncbi:MAG: hypothetical protein ACE5I2_14420 [Anaerolineae bacterium]